MHISSILNPFWGSSIVRLGPNRLLQLVNKKSFCDNSIVMAGNENKENEAINSSEDQEVTIEKVVAKDNKGIDYDKLISKYLNEVFLN